MIHDSEHSHLTSTRGYEHSDYGAAKRVCWGAILAGAAFSIAIFAVLSLLGAGIGLSTIQPTQNDVPSATAMTLGAGIWWFITSLIAYFGGSYMAAHIAGDGTDRSGIVHGLGAWAVVTVFSFLVISTAMGAIFGTAAAVFQDSSLRAEARQGARSIQEENRESNGRSRDENNERGTPAEQKTETAAENSAKAALFAAVGFLLGAGASWFAGLKGSQDSLHGRKHRDEMVSTTVPAGSIKTV